MDITPDAHVLWSAGFIKINETMVYTWIVMVVLVVGSWLITRRVTSGTKIPRWQNLLETLVNILRNQIRDISEQPPDRYLPFLGSLFIFILFANIMAPIPFYHSPTGSLSLTAALALCVFFSVPVYGIWKRGPIAYFKAYMEPVFFMAPLHLISEVSRTLSLALRLFGNVMSEGVMVAILLSLVPIILPVVFEMLGLLLGSIQAYIFFVLATVYIGAATSGAH
jgi:F-type H+-transporting ATPase subunit a